MRKEVFMAGSGGQGVLLIGQLLAQAALEEGLEVSWFPIYRPEVRGGFTSCTVVVADGAVGSPVSGRPACVLLMDQAAADGHLMKARPGGLALLNTSLVRQAERDDVTIYGFAATDQALESGEQKIANMIMLGAYVGLTGTVCPASLQTALQVVLPERHHRLIPLNMQGLQAGIEMAQTLQPVNVP
jgi:2-oxoglutarate ferredoxin oxidoreductase subunit gamma